MLDKKHSKVCFISISIRCSMAIWRISKCNTFEKDSTILSEYYELIFYILGWSINDEKIKVSKKENPCHLRNLF